MAESYYRTIEGKRYDRQMLEIAEEAVAGKGDGRMSVDDAKKLYEAIIDGNTITDIERETLAYVRENFKITEAADKWLNEALESWNAQKEAQKVKSVLSTPSVSEAEKPASVQRSAPSPKTSVVWPVLIVVLLILLPVGYFMGKNNTPLKEDPGLKAKIEELEASLRSRGQELAAANIEAERLKTRVAEAMAQPNPSPAQTAETKVPVKDKNLIIREKLAAKLEESLGREFGGSQIRFDDDHLLVSFIPEEPFFGGGSAVLKPALKDILRRFFPGFIRVLKDQDHEITEIRFQGYSSSDWKYAKGVTDTYLNNMNLSIARAEATLKFCLYLDEIEPQRGWLTDRLVSSGFSHNKPILDMQGREDPERSRRITIAVEIAESSPE